MTGNLDQPEGSLGDPQWYRSRGLILYTGLGFVLSLWLGHRSLFMAVGALVGLGLSYYLIFTGLARENRVSEQSAMGPTGSTSEGDR